MGGPVIGARDVTPTLPVPETADEHHAHLLAQGPLFRDAELDAWVVTHASEAERVLSDHDRFTSSGAAGPQPALGGRRRRLVTLDPPDHTRIRDTLRRAFAPTVIESLRDVVQRAADDAVRAALAAGEVDIVTQVANPIPLAVLAEVLGLDTRHERELLAAAQVVARNFDAPLQEREPVRSALGDIDDFVSQALGGLRAVRPGVMQALIAVTRRGELQLCELQDACASLIAAGTLTTAHVIANAIKAVLDRPWLAQRLWENPRLAASVVEETLRWDAPVQAVFRSVAELAELGGHYLLPGDRVCVVLGAANRDPSRYDDPHRFVLDRHDPPPLAFGAGIHHCLGAALARLEATIALETIASHTAAIKPSGDPPVRDRGLVLRGFARLDVSVIPR